MVDVVVGIKNACLMAMHTKMFVNFFCLFKVDGKDLTLKTGDIKYFLELNQVGLSRNKLWAHSDPVSTKDSETEGKVGHIRKFMEV